MTPSEQRFCEQVCRTAAALGIALHRFETKPEQVGRVPVVATGFEWQLPSGETVRGAAYLGMNDRNALHDACKKLSEHLAS